MAPHSNASDQASMRPRESHSEPGAVADASAQGTATGHQQTFRGTAICSLAESGPPARRSQPGGERAGGPLGVALSEPRCEWAGAAHTSQPEAWDELCRHLREHKDLVVRAEH